MTRRSGLATGAAVFCAAMAGFGDYSKEPAVSTADAAEDGFSQCTAERERGAPPAESSVGINCPADLDGDHNVNGADLALLLAQWGACNDCTVCQADLDRDCVVNGADLAQLLAGWGECPPADPFGSCCVPDGTCGEMVESKCNAIGGTFLGEGSNCGQTSCGEFPFAYQIYQLSWIVDTTAFPDSNTGRLEINFIGGDSEQIRYVNLGLLQPDPDVEPWQIRQMPLVSVQDEPGLETHAFHFALGIPMGEPLPFIHAAVEISTEPIRRMPPPMTEVPVLPVGVEFGSGKSGEVIDDLPPPEPLNFKVNEDTAEHEEVANTGAARKSSGHMQCVPIAVLTSLEWLDEKHDNISIAEEDLTLPKIKEAIGWVEPEYDADGNLVPGTGGAPTDEFNPPGWWERKKEYMEKGDNAENYPIKTTWIPQDGFPKGGGSLTQEQIDELFEKMEDDCDIEIEGKHHVAFVASMVRNKRDQRVIKISVIHDTIQKKKGEETAMGRLHESGLLDTNTGRITGITFMNNDTVRRFVIECPDRDDPADDS